MANFDDDLCRIARFHQFLDDAAEGKPSVWIGGGKHAGVIAGSDDAATYRRFRDNAFNLLE